MKDNSIDTATSAITGGTSKPSALPDTCQPVALENALPAEANDASTNGWRFDASTALGHRVVRSAILESLDLHLVLSAGDLEDGGPSEFQVPEIVIRWLLTGETKHAELKETGEDASAG